MSPSLLGVGKLEVNFQVKMQVLCIFIAKNCLWPETGTGGGLIDSLGQKM